MFIKQEIEIDIKKNLFCFQTTSFEIDIPSDFTYKGILRLTRQATEWTNYYFYSCADIEIVNPSVSSKYSVHIIINTRFISQINETMLCTGKKSLSSTNAGIPKIQLCIAIVLSCPLIGCWATERANHRAAQNNYYNYRARLWGHRFCIFKHEL